MAKGSKRRKMNVSQEEYEKNFDRAFGEYKPLKGRGVFKKCGKYSMVINGKKPRFVFHP